MTEPRLTLSKLKGFPNDFHQNGKISTVEFIFASNEVIGIIENFGTLFTPIVMDMRGNVDRLLAHHQQDENGRMYIEDMILSDEQKMTHPWLLWLKRALELIERFFWYVLNSADIINQKSDNLRPMISQAYDEVLKPYHGFLLQNTFRLLNRWMPSRKTLLGIDSYFEDNVKHLQILMPRMKRHLDKITTFYEENDLNDTSKV